MVQSIDLEDDVYAVVESLARQEHCSLDAVVNRVLRRMFADRVALEAQPSERTPPLLTIAPDTGWPSVKCNQSFATEDVYRCETDMA